MTSPAKNDRPASALRRQEIVIILTLILFSAFLRLPGLTQSFEYDEIWALTFFRAPLKLLLTSLPLPNHQPLYSLAGRLCLLTLGEKEWTVRLPAFLAGSVAPVFLFLLARHRLRLSSALAAALLFSLSLPGISFSQQARGYAFMLLASILSTGLLWSLIERWSLLRAGAYVLVSAAALYTHLYMGAIVGAHLLLTLSLLLRSPDKRSYHLRLLLLPGAAFLLAFLLYLPLLPDLAEYTRTIGRRTTGRSLSLSFAVKLFQSWTAGPDHPYLSLLIFPLLALGLFRLRRQHPGGAELFLLSLAIGFLAPALLGTFVYARFYCFALPWFYLALTAGLEGISEGLLRRRSSLLFFLLLIGTLIILNLQLPSYYRFGRQGLRPAAEWIERHVPFHKVLVVGMISEVFGYYCPRARTPAPGSSLTAGSLAKTVVVFSYPHTVADSDLQVVRAYCVLSGHFLSADEPDKDVYLYQCE